MVYLLLSVPASTIFGWSYHLGPRATAEKWGRYLMQCAVNYKCGHSGSVLLRGSEECRIRRVAYLELSNCTKCWLADQHPRFVQSKTGVRVHTGFEIREELKARGYRFSRPSWGKKMSPKCVPSELQWAASQGFDVEWPAEKPEPTSRPEWMIVVPQK